MKMIKRFIAPLLLLALALVAGWGSYIIAGPASAGRNEAPGHTGHDNRYGRQQDYEGDAEQSRDAHSGHSHGQEAHGEDLESLFGETNPAAGAEHFDEDHNGHDHALQQAAGSDSRLDHAGHSHGENEICPEHNVPEEEDALCQSDLVAQLQPGQGMKVRLAASGLADRVGIATALPLPVGENGAVWPAQAVFNRDRLARLSALAGGTVQKVNVKLGQRVEKREILAEIASPDATGLQAELAAVESRRNLAESVYLREKGLLAKGVTSRQDLQQAEADLRQAESAARRVRRQLEDYGLTPGDSASVLPVRAPFAGTVVERSAAVGEMASPGTPLFVLADLDSMWVETSIPEDSLLEVRPGQEVIASFSGLPGRFFRGKIFWIAPALDERTRMLKVLAEVDNSEGLLRSGLFGQVQSAGKTAGAALAVPAAALQVVDGEPYLFIRLADDLFELRRVAAGRLVDGRVAINRGLDPEDRVVIAQAFSLKSEVLRARLGASCADH